MIVVFDALQRSRARTPREGNHANQLLEGEGCPRKYSLSRRKALTASGLLVSASAPGLVGRGGDDDDAPAGNTRRHPVERLRPAHPRLAKPLRAAVRPSRPSPRNSSIRPGASSPANTMGTLRSVRNIWHIIGNRAIRRHAKTGDLLPELAASWSRSIRRVSR